MLSNSELSCHGRGTKADACAHLFEGHCAWAHDVFRLARVSILEKKDNFTTADGKGRVCGEEGEDPLLLLLISQKNRKWEMMQLRWLYDFCRQTGTTS